MHAGQATPMVQPPLPPDTTGTTLASVSCWNRVTSGMPGSPSHGCCGTPALPVPGS